MEKVLLNKDSNQNKNDNNQSKSDKKQEMMLENKIETELKVYMDNKQDKDNRKNNIVILRLQEQKEKTVKEEIEKDRNEVKKLLDITNPELKAELNEILDKKKYFRLGKYKKAGKIRPIKIELPDQEMKIDILKGCKNLKESTYEHISVQQDLTKDEQEMNFKLRKELRERRAAGENVCIFNNQVIDKSEHPNFQPAETDKKEQDEQTSENTDNPENEKNE